MQDFSRGNGRARGRWAAGYIAATLCLVGCGGGIEPAEDESVGSDSDAWSIPSCATATAHQTFSGVIEPWVQTGTAYNRCGYSYVIDIKKTNLDPYYYPYFAAHWNSAATSYSQSACTYSSSSDSSYLWMGAYLYEKQDSKWVHKDTREDFGQWKTTGHCWKPDFTGYVPAPCCEPPVVLPGLAQGTVVTGRDYRVAATARQYGGACASKPAGFCQISMHIYNQPRLEP